MFPDALVVRTQHAQGIQVKDIHISGKYSVDIISVKSCVLMSGLLAHAFNPSTQKVQVDLCEIEGPG